MIRINERTKIPPRKPSGRLRVCQDPMGDRGVLVGALGFEPDPGLTMHTVGAHTLPYNYLKTKLCLAPLGTLGSMPASGRGDPVTPVGFLGTQRTTTKSLRLKSVPQLPNPEGGSPAGSPNPGPPPAQGSGVHRTQPPV